MKLALALIAGSFVGADLPNPQVGECEIADIVVTRSAPTMIDVDGEITGLRIWQVCGFQVPTDTGVRAVDDTFVIHFDEDTAVLVVEAATELSED